ncbi:MAG TPA: hypothetical protein VI603_05170 [Saprospiraceae bacterium]|nr:hypothetical protein [Saprospiraceae bacterium]
MNKLELTSSEQQLYESVQKFDVRNDFEENRAILEAARELTISLIERNAIPYNRIQYFTDSAYNLGRGKSSRQEIFERNGTEGTDIYAHPHFLDYLNYFINGADLPADIKSKFTELSERGIYHNYVIDEFYEFLKATHHIPKERHQRNEFAEEVFKLAIDNNIELLHAEQLRNKIKR